MQISTAVGERSDHRMHGGQVLFRQVPQPAQVPAPAMSAGRTRTETHVLAARSVQHRSWSTLYQEIDRHADIYND